MKKMVAIIGSPRGRKSTSYNVVDLLFKQIQEEYSFLETNIISLADCEVNMCKGCAGCFAQCSTCIQYDDDIKEIEMELLSADVIIFASPVYAHSVTGTMKNFIDRISYWLHILRLTGKYGFVISVSNSNGNIFVDDYLSKMMEFMGLSVIGKLDYSNVNPLTEKDIKNVAKEIIHYLDNDTEILNYELKDNIFKVYKKAYQEEYYKKKDKQNQIQSKEVFYWKDNGYFECNTFKELFCMLNNGGVKMQH